MLKPIINPPESYQFELDSELKTSTDGLTAHVVPSVPIDYPPIDTFSVENLMRNGISLNPVGNFISSSYDDVENTLDMITEQINFNENQEF